MKDLNMGQGVKVNIAEQPWAECDCGGKDFEPGLMFKRISPIISPSQQEEHVPVEIFKCKECGLVPTFIQKRLPPIPDEMKAKAKE